MRNKAKILIVDDDVNICKAIKRLLSRDHDYEIEEAHNGLEAAKKIQAARWDLIILDINLPPTDGYDICFKIREVNKTVKIVAISGYSGAIGKASMEALGANCYFEKPFDNNQFRDKIQQLLEEKR